MKLGIRKSFKIPAPGNSLRRRKAYRLVLVRLILVPGIFLVVHYLFRMGWVVDRIVSVDAPAATLAQQASIEMLEARRAERNYLLLHNQNYLETNRAALNSINRKEAARWKFRHARRVREEFRLGCVWLSDKFV